MILKIAFKTTCNKRKTSTCNVFKCTTCLIHFIEEDNLTKRQKPEKQKHPQYKNM